MSLEMLSERIRDVLGGDPRITEKKAFGGLMFLLNGNMLVAAKKNGQLLVRLDKAEHEAALAREGVSPMEHGGRSMRGFIWVEDYAIEDEEALREWIGIAQRCAAALPPK